MYVCMYVWNKYLSNTLGSIDTWEASCRCIFDVWKTANTHTYTYCSSHIRLCVLNKYLTHVCMYVCMYETNTSRTLQEPLIHGRNFGSVFSTFEERRTLARNVLYDSIRMKDTGIAYMHPRIHTYGMYNMCVHTSNVWRTAHVGKKRFIWLHTHERYRYCIHASIHTYIRDVLVCIICVLYMCVCMCVYVHVCLCMYVCSMYVWMYVCIYVCMHICPYF